MFAYLRNSSCPAPTFLPPQAFRADACRARPNEKDSLKKPNLLTKVLNIVLKDRNVGERKLILKSLGIEYVFNRLCKN
jgi:hypothetical protein